jgi:hypothetical protein
MGDDGYPVGLERGMSLLFEEGVLSDATLEEWPTLTRSPSSVCEVAGQWVSVVVMSPQPAFLSVNSPQPAFLSDLGTVGEYGMSAQDLQGDAEKAAEAEDMPATTVLQLSNEIIKQILRVDATPQSCHAIRTIDTQLRELHAGGKVRFIVAPWPADNCVWGFNRLEVLDPLGFNQAFRETAERRGKALKRPTEVFMKTMRFCGVTARKNTRGPKETDPGERDFMYSCIYDFDPARLEYMRRKMCAYGYDPVAREMACKRTGDFISGKDVEANVKRIKNC